MENKQIEYSELREIIYENASDMSADELIETHKDLCNKVFDDGDDNLVNCGSYFFTTILSMNVDEGFKLSVAEEFFKSEYVSNYIKEGIREVLESKNVSGKVIDLLKSNKLINNMTYSGLNSIYSAMKNNNVRTYTFLQTLFRLDGKGVRKFITKKELHEELSSYILCSCGLTDRASYYSGRGVNLGDLNSDKLIKIHEKLRRIKPASIVAFSDMIDAMPTLGATEFISSFQALARNGFEFDESKVITNNYSLDGLHGAARDMVAMLNVFTALSSNSFGRNDEYYTRMIKEKYQEATFFEVGVMRAKIDPTFNKEEWFKQLEYIQGRKIEDDMLNVYGKGRSI